MRYSCEKRRFTPKYQRVTPMRLWEDEKTPPVYAYLVYTLAVSEWKGVVFIRRISRKKKILDSELVGRLLLIRAEHAWDKFGGL
jgi:hypothetical protein